jgi:transposase
MKTYTIKEIAEMYNASEITVYAWVYKGWLNVKRKRRTGNYDHELFVTEDELERFMATRPCLRWKWQNVTCEIDDIARERLNMLYDLRGDVDKEIRKYESILSLINDEEAF